MNLSTIPAAPHAQGFIKVAMEGDPAFGDRRTVNDFLITARHHVVPESGEPRLADYLEAGMEALGLSPEDEEDEIHNPV